LIFLAANSGGLLFLEIELGAVNLRMEMMIQFEDISFSYRMEENAELANSLRDITLAIKPGQAVLLCGESGCGKTTLTRIINGLIPNYYQGELSGSASLGGRDISNTPMHLLSQKAGSVFQNPRTQFFCVDTTSEIAFACENLGMPREAMQRKVAQVSGQLHIDYLLGRNIFHLSGGEKQKVACASASVLDADVMILDEPSSNLDMEAIRHLRNIILYWKGQGKTIVIAEHRLHYLKDVVDEVILMKNGVIKAIYAAREFFSESGSDTAGAGLRTPSLSLLKERHTPIAHTPDRSLVLQGFYHRYHDGFELKIDECILPQNGIIAVIGQNGAGKSTFSRCLCGLEQGSRGELVMDGRILGKRQLRKECYMVLQDTNHQLFTESVLEEILISMRVASEENALEILESLDLRQFAQCHPMALSGGQKQRVAIACAVASGRMVIVLDEPTSGLDYRHMCEVAEAVSNLQKSGKTIFIITHDPEMIGCCCTHILQIEDGMMAGNYPLNRFGMNRVTDFFNRGFNRANKRARE
jgi:energy-coupling factor transport system ATP-binding protein